MRIKNLMIAMIMGIGLCCFLNQQNLKTIKKENIMNQAQSKIKDGMSAACNNVQNWVSSDSWLDMQILLRCSDSIIPESHSNSDEQSNDLFEFDFDEDSASDDHISDEETDSFDRPYFGA